MNPRARPVDGAARRPSVVLVDAHPVVLAGLGTWLRRAGIPVVAAGDTPEVAWSSPGATADVVVLDPHLEDPEPVWADLERLVAGGRRVVVHTGRHDEETATRLRRLGCSTVVPKDEGETALVAAVLAASGNRPCVPCRPAARPRLTARERDVLLAWLRSESKRTVAALCHLSPRTVEGYIDRIRLRYAEVGRPAPTKASLVARALQDGLIGLDEL